MPPPSACSKRLKTQLDDLARKLERSQATIPLFSERMKVVSEDQEYLKGRSNPDILIHIENLDGDNGAEDDEG